MQIDSLQVPEFAPDFIVADGEAKGIKAEFRAGLRSAAHANRRHNNRAPTRQTKHKHSILNICN